MRTTVRALYWGHLPATGRLNVEVPMRRMSFPSDERGQSTAEYSLVLLVAGAIVGVFGAFVKSGALTGMFQNIVRSLVERAGG